MKIAVVGGSGKMGMWMSRFLLAEKMEVVLIGRSAVKLSAASSQLKTVATTDPRAAGAADAVIISVPIAAFEQTVRELAPYLKPAQIVVDVTSVKVMPLDIMHKYLPQCRLLGTHPVFGPGAKGLEGHNVVLTPTSDAEQTLAGEAKSWLEARGARVELMTPAEHDKLMAVVLGLAHFISIVSGDTLLGLDNLKDMELASGVTFRVLTTLIASVLREDPSLYASIQTNLPGLPAIEKEFIEKARLWAEMVEKKDSAAFIQRMSQLRARMEQSLPGNDGAYRDMYRMAEGG